MRIFLSIALLLLTVSAGYCESLSDININRLQEQTKESWGKDPFIKYKFNDEKARQETIDTFIRIKVDGIISDGEKALAIIDGGFYRVGDKIDDFVIKDISKEKVLLENNRKKYYLGIERFAIRGGKK